MAQHEMIGIFPATIVINEPPVRVIRVPHDNRHDKLAKLATQPNQNPITSQRKK